MTHLNEDGRNVLFDAQANRFHNVAMAYSDHLHASRVLRKKRRKRGETTTEIEAGKLGT